MKPYSNETLEQTYIKKNKFAYIMNFIKKMGTVCLGLRLIWVNLD